MLLQFFSNNMYKFVIYVNVNYVIYIKLLAKKIIIFDPIIVFKLLINKI